MLQTCKTCGTRYDDVYQYTICPHELIGATKAQGYCRECDLFYCMRHFGNPTPAADPNTFPQVNPEDPPMQGSTTLLPNEISALTLSGEREIFLPPFPALEEPD